MTEIQRVTNHQLYRTVCSEVCMSQHPSWDENYCWSILNVPQIQWPREHPYPSMNHRALSWKRDGPQGPFQGRGHCCQWVLLPSLLLKQEKFHPFFASAFPPYPMSFWFKSNQKCQLLISTPLIAHLLVLATVAHLMWEVKHQWSGLPAPVHPQHSILEVRTGEFCRTEVAFCFLLPHLSYPQGPGDQHQGVCRPVFSVFSFLCLESSCHRSVSRFAIHSFPLFLLECILYRTFEEKAIKSKLPEVILLLQSWQMQICWHSKSRKVCKCEERKVKCCWGQFATTAFPGPGENFYSNN